MSLSMASIEKWGKYDPMDGRMNGGVSGDTDEHLCYYLCK